MVSFDVVFCEQYHPKMSHGNCIVYLLKSTLKNRYWDGNARNIHIFMKVISMMMHWQTGTHLMRE